MFGVHSTPLSEWLIKQLLQGLDRRLPFNDLLDRWQRNTFSRYVRTTTQHRNYGRLVTNRTLLSLPVMQSVLEKPCVSISFERFCGIVQHNMLMPNQ